MSDDTESMDLRPGEWICPTCGQKQERYAPMPHHLWLKDNPEQEVIACAECHHKLTREKRIWKEAKGEGVISTNKA